MNYFMKISILALCAMIPAVSATQANLLDDVCEYNTYMCCWTQNDNGVEVNSDVCSVNGRERPGQEEVHCHGIVWAEGAELESFILPLNRFVREFDHTRGRGYYGKIKGGLQCDCVELMPIVSRADCTTYSAHGLVACEQNDLRTHYEGVMDSPGGDLTVNLVGECDN